MVYGSFWTGIWKKLLSFLKSVTLNFSVFKNCFIWVFFGLEFEKAFVIFEINILEFFLKERFLLKWKSFNLGPKMPYLDILGWNLKVLLSYLKSAPPNLPNCKNSDCKMSKFGTKNTLFLGWNFKNLS